MMQQWSDISKKQIKNILFGNGLGRTYWSKFSYKSLLETFGDEPVGRYLCTRELFTKLRTDNFEEVLRAIFHAYQVSIDNQDATRTLYVDVRKALISAVNAVHPSPKDIPSNGIGQCLSAYSSVFTTNYDLIPYWAILNGHSDKFVDYFWENSSFNLRNVDVHKNKIPVHFLHGALHLQSEYISDAQKRSISLESGIEGALEQGFINKFPLFITEGKSELKLNKIRSNSYLNFCYEKLCQSSGGMVVYGHELSSDYDGHIVDAIKQSKNPTIAVSVFSGLSNSDKEKFMHTVQAQFPEGNKEVLFYESKEHPLAQQNEPKQALGSDSTEAIPP